MTAIRRRKQRKDRTTSRRSPRRIVKVAVVNVNPSAFLERLDAALATHLSDLRNALRSLEDGTYNARARETGWFVVDIATTDHTSAPERHRVRCFQDLMREFSAYVDRLIAAKRFVMRRRRLVSGPAVAHLTSAAEGLLERCYAEVSADRSLTLPKKLNEFPSLEQSVRNSVLNLFDVRHCVEHHGGIARRPLTLSYFTAALHRVAGGNVPITLPAPVEHGELMKFEFSKSEHRFDVGERVVVTEEELEGVMLYLVQLAGPVLLRAYQESVRLLP